MCRCHFSFCCQISTSSVALFISFIIFAWFCESKFAFLLQESSSDIQASLLLSAICEMASTVLTSTWKAKFPRSHKKNTDQLNFYKLKSPTFGNEKVKFRLDAESDGPNSGAQFFLYFDFNSTKNEIVANIEYRTSRVKEFDGEFKSLKKIGNRLRGSFNQHSHLKIIFILELIENDRIELTTANFEFKKDAFSHPNCDLYWVHIEVKITLFDVGVPSFLNTWNSPGSNNSVDHADTLCQNLAVFGAESSLADVTVCTVADGEEFKVHSSILTMRSPVFAAMFAEGSFKESQEKKVYIEDFGGQVIGAFIDYLYGRKNTEWKSFAGELAEVADKVGKSLKCFQK